MAGAAAEIPVFSDALEQALREMLPSEDPLDAADFDPVNYINEQVGCLSFRLLGVPD